MKKSKEFTEDIFIWKDGKALINGKLAFIFFSQYGFPLEMFAEMVNERLPVGSYARRVLTSRAYDKVHGTDTESRVKEIYRQKGLINK